MRVQRSTLVAVLATSFLNSAAAFAPISPTSSSRKSEVYCPPLYAAGPPIINKWRYDSSKGTISGVVTNHPTIPDGDRITTSPVKNPGGVDQNIVVQTKSGSKYKLSSVAVGGLIPAVEEKKAKAKEAARLDAEKKAAAAAKKAVASKKSTPPQKAKVVATTKPKTTPSPALSAAAPQIDTGALRKLAKSKFSLTGTTVGPNGKYLLAGKPRQSSGRSAKIWTAYIADPDIPDVPVGFENGDESKVQTLTVKLSPD